MAKLRSVSLRAQGGLPAAKRGSQMRELVVMFFTIFVAEFGDKTQLATVLFASERKVPAIFVFAASAGALVAGAALAVFVGTTAGRHLHEGPLKLVAGAGFVAIGVWTLVQYFTAR